MWVFGLVDTSHTPALGYVQIVQCLDAATLLLIIQQHVHSGTIIHSDQTNILNDITTQYPV